MEKFVLIHIGFETPTQEIMDAWNKWFDSIKDKTIENLGFGLGKEISNDGTKELTRDLNAITGYLIIDAENMDEAEKIAKDCPFITSIRIYEAMEHKMK
jgi:hypothetical protein